MRRGIRTPCLGQISPATIVSWVFFGLTAARRSNVTAFAFVILRNSIAALLIAFCLATGARGEDDVIRSAVAYCAGYPQKIHLSDDRKTLCFDSRINLDLDLDPFRRLDDGGLFVVRSPGGYFPPAIAMSDLLLAKNAT